MVASFCLDRTYKGTGLSCVATSHLIVYASSDQGRRGPPHITNEQTFPKYTFYNNVRWRLLLCDLYYCSTKPSSRMSNWRRGGAIDVIINLSLMSTWLPRYRPLVADFGAVDSEQSTDCLHFRSTSKVKRKLHFFKKKTKQKKKKKKKKKKKQKNK